MTQEDLLFAKKEITDSTPDMKRDRFAARLKNNTLIQIQRLMKYHKVEVEELLEFLKKDGYETEIHAYLQKQRADIAREHKRLESIARTRAAKRAEKEALIREIK